jgi:carbon storage regulator
MLVLTRKPGEKIHIGSDVTITVLEIRGNKIRIGIEAPEEVTVLRAELSDWVEFRGVKSSEPHATLPRGRCR